MTEQRSPSRTSDPQHSATVATSGSACDHSEINGHLVSIYNLLTGLIVTLTVVISALVWVAVR